MTNPVSITIIVKLRIIDPSFACACQASIRVLVRRKSRLRSGALPPRRATKPGSPTHRVVRCRDSSLRRCAADVRALRRIQALWHGLAHARRTRAGLTPTKLAVIDGKLVAQGLLRANAIDHEMLELCRRPSPIVRTRRVVAGVARPGS